MDQRQRKFEQCGRNRIENSFPTLPAAISYQHQSLQMCTPERLPPNPPAPQVAASHGPVPPPTVPLWEGNQTKGPNRTRPKKSKKFKNMIVKKLEQKIERRMEKHPAEDIVAKINEKIKNTPVNNRKNRKKIKSLERKMKVIKRVEQRRLAAAAHGQI